MKIRPVGADADSRTDRHDELIVAFRNFANTPKMRSFSQSLFTKHDQECEGIINVHHMADTYCTYTMYRDFKFRLHFGIMRS